MSEPENVPEQDELKVLEGQIRFTEAVPEFEKILTHVKSYGYKLDDYLTGYVGITLDRADHCRQIVAQVNQLEFRFKRVMERVTSFPQTSRKMDILAGLQEEFNRHKHTVEAAYLVIMNWLPESK